MSGNLGCSATTCIHNLGGLCAANTIHVEGFSAQTSSGTSCGTFAERGIKSAITSVGNMNVIGEVKQLFNRNEVVMSPNVKCDAHNCVYNSDKICTANPLHIDGPGAESSYGTRCDTFRDA